MLVAVAKEPETAIRGGVLYNARATDSKDRIQRCIALLDLIDSHIVVTLEAFSTPVDEALEGLRETLHQFDECSRAKLSSGGQAAPLCKMLIRCQGYLRAAQDNVSTLNNASTEVATALYYLDSELKALAGWSKSYRS